MSMFRFKFDSFVIDASVAVKWLAEEKGSKQAKEISRDIYLSGCNYFVPELFHYEVPGALLDSDSFDNHEIEKALKSIENMEQRGSLFTIIQAVKQQCEAVKLAQEFNVSFYDASYLVLAIQKDAEFITADEKLIKKVGGKLTFVRSLYDYPFTQKGGRIMAEEKVGKVMDYFAKVGVAGILLEGTLKVGDTVHIKGHTSDLTLTVDSMQIDRVPVQEAGKDKTIGIKVSDRVRPGDVVYLVKP